MTRDFGRLRAAWLAAVSCAGCALLGRGASAPVHYYDPEPVRATASPGAPSAPERARRGENASCEVEIGRVTSADGVRDEIRYRTTPYDIGYYDLRRWADHPESYLTRAVTRALFQGGGPCVPSLAAEAPTLDLSLVDFDELRSPEGARADVHVLLHDGPAILWDATLTATHPAPPGAAAGGTAFDGFVRAAGAALDEVAGEIARGVEARLVGRR